MPIQFRIFNRIIFALFINFYQNQQLDL